MSTLTETAQAITTTLSNKDPAGKYKTRAMFGEYALYLNNTVVGLICDDLLYIKVCPESEPLSQNCEVGEPYSGAKPYYVIPEEDISKNEDLISVLENIAKSRSPEKTSISHKHSLSLFAEKVIKASLEIPYGKVTTYGRISRASGGTAPRQAQSVTSILAKAHESGIKNIPFHRIVFADGRAWLSESDKEGRIKKLQSEGVELDTKGRVINFIDHLHEF